MQTAEMPQSLTASALAKLRLTPRTAISPVFLVRHPGLPAQAIHDLSNRRLIEIAARMTELDARLDVMGEGLIPLLHAAVHSASQVEEARSDVGALLKVKRALFNRRPAGSNAVAISMRYLDASAAQVLEAWNKSVQERVDLDAEAEEDGKQDIFESRKRLAAWIADPAFRKGIQVASPTLDLQIPKYQSADLDNLAHKHRLIESSAVLYLNRAAAKTSPFSTFGTVIPGEWQETAPDGLVWADGTMRVAVRLNVAVLARIASQRIAAELALGQGRVVLNPTCRYTGSRIHFLRQRSRPLLRVGTTSSLHSQGAYSIPSSPLVDFVVRILEDSGAISLEELEQRVAARQGQSASSVRPLFDRLLDYGLLLALEQYDKADYDDILRYMDQASGQTPKQETLSFQQLREKAETLAVLPDIEQRRRALRGIQDALRSQRTAESDDVAGEEGLYLYEDATLDGTSAELNPAHHDNLLRQLGLLQRAFTLFDAGLPLRVALNEYFKRLYGTGATCRNVTELAEGFARECSEPFWTRSATTGSRHLIDLSFGLSQGRRVKELRRILTLRDAILRRVVRESKRGGTSIRLRQADLQQIVDAIPNSVYRELASSFFVQPLTNAQQTEWVLNKVYGGLGQMMSRFLYLWEENSAIDSVNSLREFIRSVQPEDAVFAEMRGGYDTNLNLHASYIDHEIIFPAERTAKDAQHQIPLRDLVITHNERLDRLDLTSATLGLRVVPLYLGSLITHLLPDVQRLLLYFGPSITVALPSWQTLMAAQTFTATTAFPRVTVGDVVVQRAMWMVPKEAKPVRERNDSEVRHFLKLRDWLRAQRLPNQFFAHLAPPIAAGAPRVDRNQHKPFFVDTTSLLSLLVFQKEIDKSEEGLWIAELLPAALRNDASGDGNRGLPLSEYIFDVTAEIA
jgi:hypothetical protein